MAARARPRAAPWLASALAVVGCLLGSPNPVDAGPLKDKGIDSNTPWEEKQRLREGSTAKKIALAPVRALAWPGRRVLSGMEKGLLYVEDNQVLLQIEHFQRRLADKGIFPQYGGLGDGAGLGAGVLLRSGDRYLEAPFVSLRAAASIKNFHEYEVAYAVPRAVGPLGARAGASYSRRPQEDFFGLGRDSDEADRTNYLQETIGAAVELGFETEGGIAAGAASRLRRVNISEGTDRLFPATQDRFGAGELAGLARGADLVSLEGQFAHDNTDRPGAPGRGGRASLSAGLFKAIDGQPLGYTRYRAELARYLTLYPGRVLAFHALGVITDRRRRDESVAFFDLPELGGSSTMRGFREHRFRDRDAVLFNLEYRWPLWTGMDAVLFADEGQVFDNLEDEFKFSTLRTSYGGGLRLKSPAGVFFRYEIGHSQEGTRHFFKFNQSF